MTPSDPRLRVPRRMSAPAFSCAAILALGGALAGCAPRAGDAPASRAFPRRDGPEAEIEVRWEESLDAALERGRREKKPVLIAFSARRQEHDFEGEF